MKNKKNVDEILDMADKIKDSEKIGNYIISDNPLV